MNFNIKMLLIVASLLLLFLGVQAEIPNAGFENWTGGEPDGWFTNNETGLIFVSQSSTRHAGNLAVRGEVLNLGGFGFGPVLITGNASGSVAGFPVSQRYQGLTGYYQFSPNITGVLQVSAVMAIATATDTIPVGYASFISTSEVSSYTEFSTPIFYNPGSNDPNWAVITIQIIGADGFPPVGASMLIDDLSFQTTVGIEDDAQNQVVQDYMLEQNYPNPFNPSTQISFSLPENAVVDIVIYDQIGREVDRLQQGLLNAGNHSITWSADNLPSGMYYYQLQVGDRKMTRKMMLMK